MAKNPRIDRNWRDPIRKSEIATVFGITLARIQWDFFATPSFKGTVPHTNICYGLAFRWLQELAKVCGVPYKRLLIALRGEEGEHDGRFHFHCLVGGTTTRNYHTLLHQAEWLWKIQTGGARVDVRQYDRSLAGAEYVVKCLGANAYELNKYSFANTVTLSASVRKWFGRPNQHPRRAAWRCRFAPRPGTREADKRPAIRDCFPPPGS